MELQRYRRTISKRRRTIETENLYNIQDEIMEFSANIHMEDTGYFFTITFDFPRKIFKLSCEKGEFEGTFIFNEQILELNYLYDIERLTDFVVNPKNREDKTSFSNYINGFKKINKKVRTYYIFRNKLKEHICLENSVKTEYVLKLSKNILIDDDNIQLGLPIFEENEIFNEKVLYSNRKYTNIWKWSE